MFLVRCGHIGRNRVLDLGLREAVAALKAELSLVQNDDMAENISFPIDGAQIEFHVAVRRSAEARGGLKIFVVEAGAGAAISREEIHKVTVVLGAPMDSSGTPLSISRVTSEKP